MAEATNRRKGGAQWVIKTLFLVDRGNHKIKKKREGKN